MVGIGRSEPERKNLFVTFEDKDWRMTICRCDAKPCERFTGLTGQQVTVEILKEFLPNWESVTWRARGAFGSRAGSLKSGSDMGSGGFCYET